MKNTNCFICDKKRNYNCNYGGYEILLSNKGKVQELKY